MWVASNSCLTELQTHSTGQKPYMVLKTSQFPMFREAMGIRKSTTITLLVQRSTTFQIFSFIRTEASLYNKWRLSQKTTIGHSSEINQSYRAQAHKYVCIRSSDSMAQRTSLKSRKKDCKSQNTRNSVVKEFCLKITR